MMTKKQWLAGAVLVLAAIAAYLCAFTLISTAHQGARVAIEKSGLVAASVGSVRQVVLVGVRQKLEGYNGTGCTNSTYLVVGSSGVTFVVVEQLLPKGVTEWQLHGLSTGFYSTGGGAC